MRKLKIFGPHLELRVFVTDEMIEDYRECKKDGDKDCDQCSWKDVIISEMYKFGACEMKAVENLLMKGEPGEEA